MSPRIISAWIHVLILGGVCVGILVASIATGSTWGWVGGLFAIVLLLALYAAYRANWDIPGWLANIGPINLNDTDTGETHGEAIILGDYKVRQPLSTWSDLGFILSGMMILFLLGYSFGAPNNPMIAPSVNVVSGIAILYGLIVIFMGPGSMYYHASQRHWGGLLDNLSMYLWALFVLVYDLARVARFDDGLFYLILALLVVGVFALRLFLPGSGTAIFAVLVAGYIAFGLLVLYGQPNGVVRDQGWFWAGIISFALAMLFWILSNDKPIKVPWLTGESVVQGHAVFHLLSALTTFFVFIYLRSEIIT